MFLDNYDDYEAERTAQRARPPLFGSIRTEDEYDAHALACAAGEGMVACELS